jgi:undecaprenyl-diphosphatase
MDSIIDFDKKLLLLLNSFHFPWLDPVMFYASATFIWVPFYAFLIFLIFKKYKKKGWFVLLGAAVTILLANEITSTLMKPFFARLRPSHEPSLAGMVHLVKDYFGEGLYHGGLYGFASSHAANTFGAALFVWLVLKPFYKNAGWIFLWAAMVTYTRIYLGVHYPGDILVGAMVGLASGWIAFQFLKWMFSKASNQKESISA